MKIKLLTLLLVTLSVVSCKKKTSETKNTSSNTNPSLNSFTLKKDGITYTPTYVSGNIVDEDAIAVEAYQVYGQPENNTYGLFVRKSITPGTYILQDGESGDFGLYHIQDSNHLFGWSNGSVTVISNDTTAGILHCTFDLFLYNDFCDGNCPHITDGEMTIHY